MKQIINWGFVEQLRRLPFKARRKQVIHIKQVLHYFGVKLPAPAYDNATVAKSVLAKRVEGFDSWNEAVQFLAGVKGAIELIEREHAIDAAKQTALEVFAKIKRGEWRPTEPGQLSFDLEIRTARPASSRGKSFWEKVRRIRRMMESRSVEWN